MDVLAMQTAKKVQKRMDAEYGGVYETYTAVANQKEFRTTGKISILGHTVKVFVDGILAVKDIDYAVPDENTIMFTDELQAGEIVLITTEIVGIPKFIVNNPAYDDTDLKSKIASIISALDDNSDGSILDTLSNIKAQWGSADGDLKALIEKKVEQSVVDAITTEILEAKSGKATLKVRLEEIVSLIPSGSNVYDDSVVKSDIENIKSDIETVKGSVTTTQSSIAGVASTVGVATAAIDELKTNVADIFAVLDEDKDGSIMNAFTNLKTQWTNADGELTKLISDKASTTSVKELSDVVSTVKAVSEAAASTKSVEDLTVKVSDLESKNIADFVLVDAVTNKNYKLKVENGVLGVVEV